jgi:hypothetical protein
MPSGAVASMLENEATKNTIFFDDFIRMRLGEPWTKNLG